MIVQKKPALKTNRKLAKVTIFITIISKATTQQQQIEWSMSLIHHQEISKWTCLFYMNYMFSLADIQTCLVLFSLSMLKPRCNSTRLRYDTWFKIRKELLRFMALYFTILNCSSSKSRIQFNCLDSCGTSLILVKQGWAHQVTKNVPPQQILVQTNVKL